MDQLLARGERVDAVHIEEHGDRWLLHLVTSTGRRLDTSPLLPCDARCILAAMAEPALV